MATKRTPTPPPPAAPARPPYMLIEQIQVKGYKSLVDATLHVRPLTLLAGTNSSGKSSIMQPLLLIKQTMEAPYQPAGALVLDGAHVQAETAGELISNLGINKADSIVQVGVFGYEILSLNHKALSAATSVAYAAIDERFEIISQKSIGHNGKPFSILGRIQGKTTELPTWLYEEMGIADKKLVGVSSSENGFLKLELFNEEGSREASMRPSSFLENSIGMLMHIPGLRSAPKRNYLATVFKNQIKGTFDLYAAGTISQWQQQNSVEALSQLNNSLQRLGLTNAVIAKVKNANEIELRVNRLPVDVSRTSKKFEKKSEMVNIADVGIGVSQVLPILVALIAAQEGQLVYVEQPELHLHPRAQVAMGELLAEAANRGVRVIVETHSSLLLLTVQTLIAQGKIKNTDVGLHWFTRNAKGATDVQYV